MLIARDELARKAREDLGLDVDERTIRFWAKEGLMPWPKRIDGRGLKSFYPEEMLDWVAVLASIRPSNISDIRDELRDRCMNNDLAPRKLEAASEEFDVFPMLSSWEDESGQTNELYLVVGGGLLLRKKRKGQNKKEGDGEEKEM